MCRFPDLPARRQLSYQAKQLIAREIELEKMRRTEALLQARNLGQVGTAVGSGGMVGLLMGIKFLGLRWGLGGFCSANGNPGLNPPPQAQHLAAHLPAGSTAALGHQPEGLMFVQEFGKEMLTVN